VNDEGLEGFGSPFHRGDNRRHLHEVGACADDVYDFEHFTLFSHKKAQNTQNSFLVYFVPLCGCSSQADYSRLAFASHFAVERIARVDNYLAQRANAFVVDFTVVGDDYHAVGRFKFVVG
jgi:hypothetical protein